MKFIICQLFFMMRVGQKNILKKQSFWKTTKTKVLMVQSITLIIFKFFYQEFIQIILIISN